MKEFTGDIAESLDGFADGVPGNPGMKIIILGLSITSSWGNGHATTYRGLVRELSLRGHDVLFLERDQEWYASNRDQPVAAYGRVELYRDLTELKSHYIGQVRSADLVIVGSYVPEGKEIGDWVTRITKGVSAFYDIDTPVTVSKLENGGLDYLSGSLIPRYDLYLSFTGGPLLEYIEDRFEARMVRPLYCSVDAENYYEEERPLKWDLGYMGTYSTDRQPVLDALMLDCAREWSAGRFVVAGPQYPDGIDWPSNVERVVHLPPSMHREFYNSQRFTLNVTRALMAAVGHSPSVRLFEAAACATPIVSDAWPGLDLFFKPDDEILIAESGEQVMDSLRNIPEQERIAIGRRGRARVLASHTSRHRAVELEGYVLELMNKQQPIGSNYEACDIRAYDNLVVG